MAAKKRPYKKIAFALSLCMLIVWGLMGTGASLAWFADTSQELKNVINVADFELLVSHRLEDGTYESIDGQTDIFDENALYEPGYTQVVYLKVENAGDLPFNYQTSVIIRDNAPGVNVYEESFDLRQYLKFGIVTADSPQQLEDAVGTREKAQTVATQILGDYRSDFSYLEASGIKYMAMVIYMPEEVGNEANYREPYQPEVKLGIGVTATQIH